MFKTPLKLLIAFVALSALSLCLWSLTLARLDNGGGGSSLTATQTFTGPNTFSATTTFTTTTFNNNATFATPVTMNATLGGTGGINMSGGLQANNGAALVLDCGFSFSGCQMTAANATTPAITLKEAVGHTGHILRAVDSNSKVLAFWDVSGNYTVGTGLVSSTLTNNSFNIGTTVTNANGVFNVTSAGIASTTQLIVGGGQPVKAILSNTASLSFGVISANVCANLTMTLTGAADGDAIDIGVPNAAASVANVTFEGYVSAANTVTIRACNDAVISSASIPAATFRAMIIQF